MKNNLLLPVLLGFLLLSSCQKKLNPTHVILEDLNLDVVPLSITDPNDPNLDANWNFSDPNVTTAQIYYGQRVDGQPVSSVEVLLPWFTAGNPINNEDKDYRPELGWVLYLKDFGTAERPAQTPFFALYNKYSGVLRFFFYNYRVRNLGEASKTYYIAELGFNSISNYNSSLSFYAPHNEFVKTKTNPNTKQIVVTKKDVSDTWLNFDFVMTYDTKYSELLLNVYGANQADLALGSDFSALTAVSSAGASSSSTSGFKNAMEKGYEYIGSTQSLLDAVNKLLEKLNPNSSNNQNLIQSTTTSNHIVNNNQPQVLEESVSPNSISVGTISAAIGVIKGAVGLIKSFSGGKNATTSTQTVIQYSGIVKTTGTATISNNLYSIQFHQDPNSPLTAQRYRPIYTKVTGLIGAPESFGLIATERSYRCEVYRTKDLDIYTYNTGFRYDKLIEAFISNSDLIGKVRLTKFDTYLINNNTTDLGLELASEYNTFEFLAYTPRYINNGIGFDTKHTPPVNAFKTRDNDEARITYGRYIYGLNYGNPFDNTGLNHPQIGIEIHYEIIDPNYPLEDSRERIIHKVISPSILNFTPYTRLPVANNCPPAYEHVY